MEDLTFAPRDLRMSPKIALESAPSSVRTSTKATTPLKQPPPVVEHISAESERSAASVLVCSGTTDTSPASIPEDCRGRWTADMRVDVEADRCALGWTVWDVSAAGLVREPDDARLRREDDSAFFIFNFSSASLNPFTRCDVSRLRPSRREVLMLEREPAAGAETERGDTGWRRVLSTLFEVLTGARGGRTGLDTIRCVGRANGPDPSEEG